MNNTIGTVLQEFDDLKPIAASKPKSAYIESTNRCNTRCMHCMHYHRTDGTDMSEEITHKAIDALVGGAEMIVAQGTGEPLISDSFYMILEACEKSKVQISFTTNAIKLRNENLVKRLVRAPANILVSIDGARAETYNFVRPQIDWNQFLENLALVKRCQKEAGEECRSIMMFLCVAMKDTFSDLPDLVRMAHKYGVFSIIVQALSGDNDIEKLRDQSPFNAPDIIVPATLEGMAVAKELGVYLVLPPSFHKMACEYTMISDNSWLKKLSYGARSVLDELQEQHKLNSVNIGPKTGISPCLQPWDWTFVASNGIVSACCMSRQKLGDLNVKNWDDIWNGARYQTFRQLVHSWNPPSTCRKCIFPLGINKGDNKQYERYFSQFQSKSLELDSDQVKFCDEFDKVEEKGQQVWCLKGKTGSVSLPMHKKARFLRFSINGSNLEEDFSPGICVINNGQPEPFDLSPYHLFLPIDHITDNRLEAHFEMNDFAISKLIIKKTDLLF